MNSKSAISTIRKILGIVPEKFFEAKTEQGLAIKMEGELELGGKVYVATEEGLIPAPPGSHKLDDGTMLEIDEEGKLAKIDMGQKEEEDEEEEMKKVEDTEKKKEMMALMFADVRLKTGSTIRMEADEPMIGARVKLVGYNGSLSALQDGLYETDGGLVLSINGGSIQGVQSAAENTYRGTQSGEENTIAVENIRNATAMVFTIAKDAQGNKLESPTFDVGEPVEVIGEDGEKSKAPDGEHQVVLKDESGNENKIRIMTKDGKITERENVEEMEKTIVEMAELFRQAMAKVESKLDTLVSKQKELENKFQKFSKEPAAPRVFTQKTINEPQSSTPSKYDAFRRLREDLTKNLS